MLIENGNIVSHLNSPAHFLVDIIAHKAADLIRRSADTALVRRFSAWLKALTTCVGAECRAAEDRPSR